jgi:hypothetical protein
MSTRRGLIKPPKGVGFKPDHAYTRELQRRAREVRDAKRAMGRPYVEELPRDWLLTARVTKETAVLAKMLARRRKEAVSDLIRALIEEEAKVAWGGRKPPGFKLYMKEMQRKGRGK